jgi:hypothetical protein
MHFEPVSGYEQIDNEYRYILGRPAEFKRTCDWCDFSQIWTHKYLPRSFNEMMLGGEDAAVAAVIHHMQREHPDELAARLASGPIRLPKRHSWHRSKPEPDELCPPPEDFGMQVGPGLPLPQLPVEYQPKPRKPKPKATA